MAWEDSNEIRFRSVSGRDGRRRADGRHGARPAADQQTGQGQTGEPLVQTQAGTADAPPATIGTAESGGHGTYLVDDDGRAVYLFEADTQGQGDEKAASACHDDCAAAWPPVLSQGGSAEAKGDVDAGMLGTIEREDGTTQVTYNGWPLYYFVKDEGAAEPTGQDVEDFGAEWYLVTPEGEKVDHE